MLVRVLTVVEVDQLIYGY